jgi:hypothetical protein
MRPARNSQVLKKVSMPLIETSYIFLTNKNIGERKLTIQLGGSIRI